MKEFNYENKLYFDKLNDLKVSYYSKYVKFIKKYLKEKNNKFLDVGCGNGTVLSILKEAGYKNGYGVDISKLFINEGKKKNLSNLYYYDGENLPFENGYFDLIGTFNVLEHTKDPLFFLREQINKLKSGGYLIVACPNFFSPILNPRNPKLKGYRNKIKRILLIPYKIIKSGKFEKMGPVVKKDFVYDDDAIVITNSIDLKKILTDYNCEIVYESGFINYDSQIFKIINSISFIRYLLPSCFIVARKK